VIGRGHQEQVPYPRIGACSLAPERRYPAFTVTSVLLDAEVGPRLKLLPGTVATPISRMRWRVELMSSKNLKAKISVIM
jgi:hypothetical protein